MACSDRSIWSEIFKRSETVRNIWPKTDEFLRSEIFDGNSGQNVLTEDTVRKFWRKIRSEIFDGYFGQKVLTGTSVGYFWQVHQSETIISVGIIKYWNGSSILNFKSQIFIKDLQS